MNDIASPWFVLRAETGREEKVFEQVLAHGMEAFLPFYSDTRRWSRRPPEIVRRALFPGYIFGRFEVWELACARAVPGVIDILSFGPTAATVPDVEIENLRVVVASGLAEPWNLLKVGQQVTITHGPFAGIRGRLIEIKNKLRFVVGVELFNRGVSVEVESGMLAA